MVGEAGDRRPSIVIGDGRGLLCGCLNGWVAKDAGDCPVPSCSEVLVGTMVLARESPLVEVVVGNVRFMMPRDPWHQSG